MKKTIILPIIALLIPAAFVVWKWQEYVYEKEISYLEWQLLTSAKFFRAIEEQEKITTSLQQSQELLSEFSSVLPDDSPHIEENVLNAYANLFSRQQVKAILHDSRKENKEFYKAINHTFRLEGAEENIISVLKNISENRVGPPYLIISTKSSCEEATPTPKGVTAWQVSLETYSYTGEKYDPSAKPKKSLAEKLRVEKSRVWLPPFSNKIASQQKALILNKEKIMEYDEAEEVFNKVFAVATMKQHLEKRIAIIKALQSKNENTVDFQNIPLCGPGK